MYIMYCFSILYCFFLVQVRKQLRDMEAKVKDQEEELDEQAGTIQMLEQVQTKPSATITGKYHLALFLSSPAFC